MNCYQEYYYLYNKAEKGQKSYQQKRKKRINSIHSILTLLLMSVLITGSIMANHERKEKEKMVKQAETWLTWQDEVKQYNDMLKVQGETNKSGEEQQSIEVDVEKQLYTTQDLSEAVQRALVLTNVQEGDKESCLLLQNGLYFMTDCQEYENGNSIIYMELRENTSGHDDAGLLDRIEIIIINKAAIYVDLSEELKDILQGIRYYREIIGNRGESASESTETEIMSREEVDVWLEENVFSQLPEADITSAN